MTQGAFAQFRALDRGTRALVLRRLDSPNDADFRDLDQHPQGTGIAQWLLTLPSYVNATDTDNED